MSPTSSNSSGGAQQGAAAGLDPDVQRRGELAANLTGVRARIAAAAMAAHRSIDEITLIGVTKFFPVSDATSLVELGLPDLGESRDQEAAAKAADVAAATGAPARWHFVGQLQTNKARSVARYAHAVHSVDRVELVTALAAGCLRADRCGLEVFLQIDLNNRSTGRGGVRPTELLSLADAVAASESLRLAGVMAVAPQHADPDAAFAELARCAQVVQQRYSGAGCISAGMSGDLEAALRHGATHLRIGTALLGHRSPRVG